MSSSSTNSVIKSWVIYASSADDTRRIQRVVDTIFSDYSYYMEIEWSQYGFSPPQNHNVLGAWRKDKSVFVFLLTLNDISELLLYVAGDAGEIALVEHNIADLKKIIKAEDKKEREI